MTYRVNLIRWGDHNYHNYMGDQKIIMAVLPLLISQIQISLNFISDLLPLTSMGSSNGQETDIATGQCRDEALYSITGPFAFREKDT